MRLYGITGWKNAGKTTLVERLVARFAAEGLRVATVKHTHHPADIDLPGGDSHRHRMAGAVQVILASPARWALVGELRGAPEPPLAALLAHLDPCDLVLVEGYKAAPHPKIEVHRAATGHPLMAPDDPTIRAVAADGPRPGLRVPRLPLDDVAAIAAFLRAETGL